MWHRVGLERRFLHDPHGIPVNGFGLHNVEYSKGALTNVQRATQSLRNELTIATDVQKNV
jgi:hypothetical protein